MPDQAIVILPISLETSLMMKLIKEKMECSNMSDSELIIYLVNRRKKRLKESNLEDVKKVVDTNERLNSIPEVIECKKEKEIIHDNSNDIIMKQSIGNVECKDCNERFQTESELLTHFDSHHKPLDQSYKCFCGKSFNVLRSYLQHNLDCQPQLECSNPPKRHSEDRNETVAKRVKLAKSNLPQPSSSSNQFGQLSNHPVQDNKSERNQSNSTHSLESKGSSEFKSGNSSSLKFACHCLMEFSDYYEFSAHTNQCGKPKLLESTSNQSVRTSPLKVSPNADGKYECKDCNKLFTSILSLRQHWDGMHREDAKYICKKCGREYRWCTSFHYHKRKCEKEN